MPSSPLHVAVDLQRNLIRMHFRGHVTAESLRAGWTQVEAGVGQLKPQFSVLTDLSGLEAMELDCVGELTRTMDLFRLRHAGMVVRVIPDPNKDIGFNILSIIHYRGGVKVVTCETGDEAERVLAPA